MPLSGASFAIASRPAFPKPVFEERTPIRVAPIRFICWNTFWIAWLSFCAVLKTKRATGFTIASAAAQESSGVFASSAICFTAIVSPLVAGPMIAKTCSSSMSCFAKEMAFSGLAPVSFTTSSTLRPARPPLRFSSSTSISSVRASGAPRKEAGPVTASRAPTLMGSCGGAAARARASSMGVGVIVSSILFAAGSLRPSRPRCGAAATGSELLDVLGTEDLRPGRLQRLDGGRGFLEPEHDEGLLAALADEGVHVLDGDAAEGVERRRETARTIGDLDGDDRRLAHREPRGLEGAERALRLVHDEPQDAEVGLVRKGERADVDVARGEHVHDVGEAAGLVLEEDGELFDHGRSRGAAEHTSSGAESSPPPTRPGATAGGAAGRTDRRDRRRARPPRRPGFRSSSSG